MEKKPIKRSEQIQPLSREHHATLLFCWKIEEGVKRGIEKQRIDRYAGYFYPEHVVGHFTSEEKLLFTDRQDPKVRTALMQHETIREFFEKIQEGRANFPNDYLSLAALLRSHTRYEERDLFPHVEQNLPPDELDRIGTILNLEEHTAEEQYNDEFWRDAKSQ